MNKASLKKLGQELNRQNPLTEHAMEFVATIAGVTYINDSGSITVDNTWDSLNSCPANIILIIGGIDNRNDYSVLEELVSKKVKTLICLGTDNSKLMKALLTTGKEMRAAISVQESVELADKITKEGDIVLFSPSCPSYHPFDNYKNRGDDFKRVVKSIQEKK